MRPWAAEGQYKISIPQLTDALAYLHNLYVYSDTKLLLNYRSIPQLTDALAYLHSRMDSTKSVLDFEIV